MSERQYKISVVLPTRGRTTALSRSVISLFNRVVDKGTVQLILGFDEDDEIGIGHFEKELQPWLDEKGVDYEAMVFEPLGYTRLNEYVNAMAAASDSDWIVFWNDDAVMETTGWDRIITSHTGEFKLLAVHTHKDHPYSIFPIVPKEWFDVLGYLSPHQINDCWLSQQAFLLDNWERIEVYVTHDRFDLTGNNKDATYTDRIMYEGNPSDPKDFHHASWTLLRHNDCDRLATYMRGRGIDTSWWDSFKAGTNQHPFKKMYENDPNGQVRPLVIDPVTGKRV
jgi:hypothetical protein